MAAYYFKVISGYPVTGTPVGSRTENRRYTNPAYSRNLCQIQIFKGSVWKGWEVVSSYAVSHRHFNDRIWKVMGWICSKVDCPYCRDIWLSHPKNHKKQRSSQRKRIQQLSNLPSHLDNATHQGIFISQPDMGISAWNARPVFGKTYMIWPCLVNDENECFLIKRLVYWVCPVTKLDITDKCNLVHNIWFVPHVNFVQLIQLLYIICLYT